MAPNDAHLFIYEFMQPFRSEQPLQAIQKMPKKGSHFAVIGSNTKIGSSTSISSFGYQPKGFVRVIMFMSTDARNHK